MKKPLLFLGLFYSFIAYSQNTGIGTATPLRKLHIAGGVRIDTLAGTEDGFVKFNSDGDLVRFPQSNNPAHVLRGDGTWGVVPGGGSLPTATIVGSPYYENTALINIGFSLIGELPITFYDNQVNETYTQGRWVPTYVTGIVGKRPPLQPSLIPGVVWAPETARMYVCQGGYIQSYDPVADQWDSVSLDFFVHLPSVDMKAVWTGTTIVVWGGDNISSTANGMRYTPATNTWQTITQTNQPVVRSGYTMVWAGNRVIIWGGQDINGNVLNDGALYDPITDTWTTINPGPLSARKNHTAVWSPSVNGLLIWGGSSTAASGAGAQLNDGAIYRPTTNLWIAPINPTGAPSPRHKHTAVWTGTEMIIYGGLDNTTPLNTGFRYNPSSGGTWTALAMPPIPASYDHAATWTGSMMVVSGGVDASGFSQAVASYDPAGNSWTMPNHRSYSEYSSRGKYRHYSLLAGNMVIIWGGYDEVSRTTGDYPPSQVPANTGYRLFLADAVSNATYLSPTAKMYLYIKN
jgi:N-acetylneuraminic acid mutarotase